MRYFLSNDTLSAPVCALGHLSLRERQGVWCIIEQHDKLQFADICILGSIVKDKDKEQIVCVKFLPFF